MPVNAVRIMPLGLDGKPGFQPYIMYPWNVEVVFIGKASAHAQMKVPK